MQSKTFIPSLNYLGIDLNTNLGVRRDSYLMIPTKYQNVTTIDTCTMADSTNLCQKLNLVQKIHFGK